MSEHAKKRKRGNRDKPRQSNIRESRMKLYHRTPAAEIILKDGFKDGEGFFLANQLFTGVWLSDRPLTSNEGTKGDSLLTIEIPETVLLQYEWLEEGKPYREFLVPANLVNAYGLPNLCDEFSDD